MLWVWEKKKWTCIKKYIEELKKLLEAKKNYSPEDKNDPKKSSTKVKIVFLLRSIRFALEAQFVGQLRSIFFIINEKIVN